MCVRNVIGLSHTLLKDIYLYGLVTACWTSLRVWHVGGEVHAYKNKLLNKWNNITITAIYLVLQFLHIR